jgi:hypothetical protein
VNGATITHCPSAHREKGAAMTEHAQDAEAIFLAALEKDGPDTRSR